MADGPMEHTVHYEISKVLLLTANTGHFYMQRNFTFFFLQSCVTSFSRISILIGNFLMEIIFHTF